MYYYKNYYFIFTFLLMGFSLMCFFMGLYLFNNSLNYMIEWSLINFNGVNIQMIILFDWMSMFFLMLVSYISSLIVNYSKSYMSDEKNGLLFIILIMLFVISMFMMIVSPNMISILLGWDGLGLVSYLLVIYYKNVKSYNAGMLTVLSNRIGDVMILISIGLMFNLNSWNYMFYMNYENYYYLSLFIIVAGLTKSAQIPFSSWLPAAMAAPTPVSALVHSSTLVTAGVYLLIRFFSIFEFKSVFLSLLIISGLTMFMAGLGANLEYDLKKIIALSTLSQLGLMMMTLSLGLVNLCYFHLLSHALFKALLFMCAGFMIHSMGNCQDIRYMGGLSKQIPMIVLFFNSSNLSLCGFPFLAGFYSKDLILESISMYYLSWMIYFMFFFCTALTILYSIRLFMFLMMSENNMFNMNYMKDNDFIMWKSMMGLFLGSVCGGSLLIWLIFPFFNLILLPYYMKLITLLMIFLMFYLSLEIYKMKKFNKYFFYKLMIVQWILGSMWMMSYLSTYPLNKFILNLSYVYKKYIDLGWMEKLGGQGMKYNLINYSKMNYNYQGISFKMYLFIFIYMYILILLIWLIY